MTFPDALLGRDGASAGVAGCSVPAGTGWPAGPAAPPPAGRPDRAAHVLAAGPKEPAAKDRSGIWLRNAAAGLGLLAVAAAAVSFTAQYRMVYTARRLPVVAGLEAVIPDAAALIFACLGIALALHGRRAVRARLLNVTAVGTSVFMNAIAAAPGWRGLAIWVMPPVAYALASDTLIGVVRTRTIARHKALREALDDDESTPLAVLGGLLLWVLRLAVAPRSTLRGLRAWVITECPAAPGRPSRHPATGTVAAPADPRQLSASAKAPVDRQPAHRPGTKTAAFLALAARAHGSLAAIPLDQVSKICAELAPKAGLNAGAARTALRRAVIAARNGSNR